MIAVTDISMNERSFQLNPWPVYEALRKDSPVYWSSENNCYFVMDYKHVREVLMDQERYTVEHPFRTTRHLYGPTIIDLDGERHKKLRGLVGARFRKTSVAELTEAVVRPVVKKYVKLIGEKQKIDIMSEFAQYIPTEVILNIIGLPVEDSKWVYEKLRPIMSYLDYPRKGLNEAINASDELERYIEERMSNEAAIPPDTMLADLRAASQAGQVTSTDIVRHILLFLSAGTETTIGTIGNMFVKLLEHPAVLSEIYNDSSLLNKVIQETLRFEPPLHTTTRIAKQESELAGLTIPKGAFLQLVIASANRDESMYEEPDIWNPYREKINHLSFGAGVHNCVGFQLALKELEVVLEEFLSTYQFSYLNNDKKPIIEGRSFHCPQNLWLELDAVGHCLG